MSPVHVLIVDDAVVVRRTVSEVLGADPDLSVVGTAANGRIALQKLTQLNPDVVTLDLDMPEMDGIETLRAIRALYPGLPVIMFAAATERGAADALNALAAGASDYVTKPAGGGSVEAAQQHVREQLIPKIKALCEKRGVAPAVSPRVTAAAPVRPRPSAGPQTIDVIAIGVSTGGPNALAAILPALPAALRVPIVVVQHMPPMFTRLLAERLNAQSAIEVVEARGGEIVTPGTAYVAPGDFHLTVVRDGAKVRTALTQAPPENSCRPSVDVLFRSVAAVFGRRALAVVLTGMGQDGLRGCEELRASGAEILAQDEATSVVWGMAGFVAKAGLADAIVPLPDLAVEVVRRASRGGARS